jgi:hypothetical protein
VSRRPLLLLATLALAGCGLLRPQVVDVERAARSDSLEFLTDEDGYVSRLEYHIAPGETPPAVRAAMDRMHPGDPYTGAQIEVHGRQLLYELSRTVDGLAVAAVFRPDGTLVNEELQIPEERAPESVREIIAERFPGAAVPRYDEVRDGQRAVRAYHVRLRHGARDYKLVIAPDGVLLQALLEVDAEVVVPVEVPEPTL